MSLTRRALASLAALVPIGSALRARAESTTVSIPMERGYARGPYGLVHYRDTGKGKPLVLFHQAPMTSRQFESVYPLFAAQGFRAIGIDMPGFGGSDVTPFVPKIEDWAKVVPPVLDHLGIKQADMVGHHTGSCVATEVCLQFPSRARNLVIHAALLVTEEERKARLARVEGGEKAFVYKEDGSHLTDSFNGRKRMYGADADPKLITRYVIESFTGSGPNWYGHNAAYVYNHTEALKKVKHRTQVMSNSGDMVNELTQRAKTLRPDMSYVELPGGNVDIVDQSSQAWVDAITKFLSA